MSNPLTTTIPQTAKPSFVVGFHAKRSENTAWLSQQWSAPGLQKVSVKESHGNRGESPTKACMVFHRWWADKPWEMGGSCSVWLAGSCYSATINKRVGLCCATLIIHICWMILVSWHSDAFLWSNWNYFWLVVTSMLILCTRIMSILWQGLGLGKDLLRPLTSPKTTIRCGWELLKC